jgi:hypothetical protein
MMPNFYQLIYFRLRMEPARTCANHICCTTVEVSSVQNNRIGQERSYQLTWVAQLCVGGVLGHPGRG